MPNTWTPEQSAAIETRDKTLLISAAAGSGKTAVLTERIIRLLTDPETPASLERMLIVTFSRAAAAELRQRISLALGNALAADPGNRHLHRQLLALSSAKISTIHAYCLELIRTNFQRLGLPARFRIADDAEAKVLARTLMDSLISEREYHAAATKDLEIGVNVLPKFPRDNTDRNRTSPFAFTGNKFEFRSLGSSASIAETNVVLNTIVADVLMQFADELEGAADFNTALHDLIVRTLRKHNRVIFNGNGYANAWVEEAARRGLPNYASTVDALPHLLDEKNVAIFARQGIYSQAELHSRYEISLEYYAKAVNIEAETCLMMAEREIFPACAKFAGAMGRTVRDIKEAGVEPIAEMRLLKFVTDRNVKLFDAINNLREAILATDKHTADALEHAQYERYIIIPAMAKVREVADDLEELVGKEYWPFPTYDDLLFNV